MAPEPGIILSSWLYHTCAKGVKMAPHAAMRASRAASIDCLPSNFWLIKSPAPKRTVEVATFVRSGCRSKARVYAANTCAQERAGVKTRARFADRE